MATNERNTFPVVGEWYAQLAVAARTPGLAQHLVLHMGRLLPRFLAFYARLRSLPRRLRRALARTRGLSFGSVALLLALCGTPVDAALITVDQTSCRFEDAVEAANADAPFGGCPAGSGEDFLLLESNVTLSGNPPFLLTPMTIQARAGSVIDGDGGPCLVAIYDGNVNLAGVTVQHCHSYLGGGCIHNTKTMVLDNVTLDDCGAASNAPPFEPSEGGAIWNYGTLTATGTTIRNSFAYLGGGIHNVGTMSLDHVTIEGNTALWEGGGIWNQGSLSIVESTISGNEATGGSDVHRYSYAAALRNDYGAVTITNSTISGNTTGSFGYGAVLTFGGALTISGSTISGNTATSWGGIVTYATDLTISDSTISGNVPGGVLLVYGENRIEDSTVVGNNGGPGVTIYLGSLTLERSIVAGNNVSYYEVVVQSPSVTISTSYNVFGSRVFGFRLDPTDDETNLPLADIVGPLLDNGGPTLTRAAVFDGPAVDLIPSTNSGCVGAVDQRGFPRPAGDGCDAGSFEYGARLPVAGSVTGLSVDKVICKDRSAQTQVKDRSGNESWNCESLGLVVTRGDSLQTLATGTVDATDAHVGGAVTAIATTKVTCENVTTGQRVQAATSATSWDCEAMGLDVSPGDTVTTGVQGTADLP